MKGDKHEEMENTERMARELSGQMKKGAETEA